MESIYKDILNSIAEGKKLLAVLIDPDKMNLEDVSSFIGKVNASIATHIFVGGSIVDIDSTQILVKEIKKYSLLPVVLFPGDITQITNKADALLFLSLISGRNPDYLISKHVEAVPLLQDSSLEVIPTGYILIENGKPTAVQQVTETKPLSRSDIETIVHTAKAGEHLGMKLIYLEAGSGASHPVNNSIIQAVKSKLQIPLIVGGGIRCLSQLEDAYSFGAEMVVIGTAFEKDELFFDELKKITRESIY